MITFSNKSVSYWIENIDLLIYNSSGTVFDAIHQKTPSLYIGPQNGIDLNKFTAFEHNVCRDVEDIKMYIEEIIYSNTKTENLTEKNHSLLPFYFAEPNKMLFKTIICD